ncbi:hypothetical protein HNP86_001832 [Methanococcus maripaludis]|uniref:Uncharacterized protein n=1 Tax=Methanococcus maripaludis TaxID=39152 RepID=A0A7J9NXD0_METMI|nr:hypothetical protein [Methanococcus maripaludis]MBA2851673.1 hypothetical protein [Methanococcus maripaludis]
MNFENLEKIKALATKYNVSEEDVEKIIQEVGDNPLKVVKAITAKGKADGDTGAGGAPAETYNVMVLGITEPLVSNEAQLRKCKQADGKYYAVGDDGNCIKEEGKLVEVIPRIEKIGYGFHGEELVSLTFYKDYEFEGVGNYEVKGTLSKNGHRIYARTATKIDDDIDENLIITNLVDDLQELPYDTAITGIFNIVFYKNTVNRKRGNDEALFGDETWTVQNAKGETMPQFINGPVPFKHEGGKLKGLFVGTLKKKNFNDRTYVNLYEPVFVCEF